MPCPDCPSGKRSSRGERPIEISWFHLELVMIIVGIYVAATRGVLLERELESPCSNASGINVCAPLSQPRTYERYMYLIRSIDG